MASTAATITKIRRSQRAEGPAAVLSIGTANPANCVSQDDFPDYYFRVTNSENLTDLKDKFRTVCEKTSTEQRFFHHTEELLSAHPEFIDRGQPSLAGRLAIAAVAAPELAASAAAKAIAEWGRPAADITHLIVSTNSGAHAPGTDLRLAALLGLRSSTRRTLLQLSGCNGGSASLRLAKDLAENNRGARVLVACVELNLLNFRGPEAADPDALIRQAMFGDGAAAAVVGADPVCSVERPIFVMVSASQTVVPGTDHVLTMKLTESGLDGDLLTKELVPLAADNIVQCLADAFGQLGIAVEWNDLFWAVHPGMRAILVHIEGALRLESRKLSASRSVLRQYGNMLGATVMFVLDEVRRRMDEEDGAEWGVMMGFGPGFTIETMILHACSS